MEASELTLIEISAEDDSLLHQLPSNDVVSASTSVLAFDFSPLQIPRSNISSSPSGKKRNADSSILGSGSSYSNKENLNNIGNKSGTRNLSVERQRMKKGRKGYNLRKSLAWDKAFFTEEGVLDSEELSMISGMSHVDRLSVIDEERRDSLTMASAVASGSANIETLEENLFKELPSGQPSKLSTSSSLPKRDSLSGSRLPMISRSSQKALANRGLSKSGSKPGVCTAPVAPSSQKRLLNTGTTKVMTRNSKIPRVPISKHPPLPSTNVHALSGSQLKSPVIAQPGAQKSTSLTLPAIIKSASKVASISSGGTSKSIKHLAANARKDLTCSSSEIGSSTTNHKARSTGKVSNCLQNNSKPGLPVKMIEPVNGTSRSRISSQLSSDNGDRHRKDAQSQGIKASGLRMPSPSMKFFSEGNKKSSNLKSSIPTFKKSEAADHVSDFKQIKVQHGSLNHDAVSKKRLSSQVAELCSTASLIDPIEHTKAKHAECSQEVVQQEVPLGDRVPHPTNNADDMKNPLNDIDIQCINENPTSLTVEEKDMNTFVDINSTDPSLNQNRNADGNTMNSSFACSKVQRPGASSAIGDVCPTLDEETGCRSSTMNDGDLLESGIDFNSQHINFTLADSNPSTSMPYNEKNPGECIIDNFVHSNSEGNINRQLGDSKLFADDQSSSDMDEGDSDSEETRSCIPKCGIVGGAAYEYVNKEQDDVMVTGSLSAAKFGVCLIEQDIVSNHVPRNENSNISSAILKISGGKEISNINSILREPESTDISNHSRTSFLELSDNDADHLPYLPFSLQGPQEPPLFHGHEIVDTGCQSATSVSSKNGTEAAGNREVELTQEESDDSAVNLAVSKRDDMDLSNCVQLKDINLNRHHEGSNIEILEDIHQVHNSVQEVEFQIDLISCLPDKSNNSTFQNDGTVSAEEPETKCNMKGNCSDYDAEANTNGDMELSQVLNDDSIVNLATSKTDILELNNDALLKDCSLSRDQEGSNIEISDDIYQVHISVEEVEAQTESFSCLSRNGNNSTFQTDGSVSVEEPETNCNMEGICSDYGTEANINRDIELSKVLNDDSVVNLMSKRDILELNNGELLKDCSLSRDQEGSNIENSDDIYQVHISVEELKIQTDSVSCLSSKGNNSIFQTDGSVSAEVPETECDTEGICFNYRTEATVYRSIEFEQVMNDDSTVNMGTSNRDGIEFNNGVVLKDSILERDQGGSNIEISGDLRQVQNCVEEVEFLTDLIICLPSKVSHAAHQIDDSVSAEETENKCNMEGVCSDCGTEAIINRSIEFTQVVNDDSILNMATPKRDDIDLNNGVVLKDSFLKVDRGGSNIEISGDILQVHNCVEEVEYLTDSVSCLSSKGNNATHQTDSSVSAEESESKCNMEGICSDCGTEAAIDRNIEFSEGMNDDSTVNLATSKSDDMDLNNAAPPKDSFLKTDRGGSNTEISGDIHQVHFSVDEVEFQTDSVSCLSSKDNNATHQTDGGVSAEEYENKCNTEGIVSLEEINANLERTDNQNVSITPPHAVPFSDEWLAALESAGEEILTMKTGAVQHSPTDKSAPEPSPWSPVKRKTAQVIGPFDCTKHTHIQPDQSE